jgi:hypothetical protein
MTEKIDWENSLSNALQRAEKEQKRVLVDFTSPA